MFKPHYGECKNGHTGKIVVKSGYCERCNHENKQSKKQKSGRLPAADSRYGKRSGISVSEPEGQDIEGYTTIFRSPIRKKKPVQRGGKRTSKDKIREKVHFGKTSGLQGIKKEHTRVYMQALGYTIADFIPCELSGHRCNDVHHIYARGMGGSDLKDELYNRIENLMGLTRELHTEYGDKEQHYEMLIEKHFEFLSASGVTYDKHFFEKWPK